MIERNAIMEEALHRYAPDLALTEAQTNDADVMKRFNKREGVRNRLRFPRDLEGMKLAVCVVQRQPALAIRLYRAAPGTPLERGVEQALINRARACIGDAKTMSADPTLFRVYVVDALYRWVVAARNVDTLLPAADAG